MYNVCIIIPTIGTQYVYDAIKSAVEQEYPCRCIVVTDGEKYRSSVENVVSQFPSGKIELINLPFNTGHSGYNGHRIYASLPFLLDTDYIAYLDEDNILEKNHISSMISLIEEEKKKGKDPAMIHSLRSIIHNNGEYLCNDNFESIGPFADTSTMLLKKDIACRYGYLWIIEENISKFSTFICRPNDRILSCTLYEKEYCVCTRKYTIRYRSYDDKRNSPLFFKKNSSLHLIEPWNKKTIYIVHFSPVITNHVLSRYSNENMWKGQWQYSIVDALRRYYHVKNVYTEIIPTDAIVVFICCNTSYLPESLYKRNDIRKILIAMESFNHMHRYNFSDEFLSNFNEVVTYNKFPKTDNQKWTWKYTVHPINVDFLYDHWNEISKIQNIDSEGKICCVLADRRDSSVFEGCGITVKSTEYLRYAYAKYLKIDCYGNNWKSEEEITAMGFDQRHPVDIHRNYSFSLIIENQNIEGGITEKIYHAIIADSIPLYYYEHGSIPHIPDCCWINIANIKPEDLQEYLNSIDIDQYKKNILEHRESILRAVSADTYGKQLHNIIL